MNLFKYENYRVVIDPSVLLLKPFKALLDRDKTKDKQIGLLELDYVYLFSDPRSDFYKQYSDDSSRMHAIIDGLGLGKWRPDNTVLKAVEYYKSFVPTGIKLLNDMKKSIDNLRSVIVEFDANDTEDPVKSVKDMSSALKTLLPLIGDIDAMEKKINSDMLSDDRIRGNIEKNILEDPLEEM